MGSYENHDTFGFRLLSPGDMSYLREGDRMMLRRVVGARPAEQVLATAHMDGHRVSSEYGVRAGNRYFDDPQKNYINVKFDHVLYTDTRPNSTIYQRDNWTIYVSKKIYDRIAQDKAAACASEEKARLLAKIAEAEQVVADLRKQVDAL